MAGTLCAASGRTATSPRRAVVPIAACPLILSSWPSFAPVIAAFSVLLKASRVRHMNCFVREPEVAGGATAVSRLANSIADLAGCI